MANIIAEVNNYNQAGEDSSIDELDDPSMGQETYNPGTAEEPNHIQKLSRNNVSVVKYFKTYFKFIKSNSALHIFFKAIITITWL